MPLYCQISNAVANSLKTNSNKPAQYSMIVSSSILAVGNPIDALPQSIKTSNKVSDQKVLSEQ